MPRHRASRTEKPPSALDEHRLRAQMEYRSAVLGQRTAGIAALTRMLSQHAGVDHDDAARRRAEEREITRGQVRVIVEALSPGITTVHLRLATPLATAIWQRRRAPLVTVGVGIGDPHPLELMGCGAYSPIERTVYVDPVRAGDLLGDAGYLAYLGTLAHELAHAAQHAEADADGRTWIEDTTAPSYDYAQDPKEQDADREERAVMIGLTGSSLWGTLDEAAGIFRFDDGIDVELTHAAVYHHAFGPLQEDVAALEHEYNGRMENPHRVWPATPAEAAARVRARTPAKRRRGT